MILVGGPSGRRLLAREIGVGDVHVDIVEFPETEERVRRVLNATPGRRGADVILECAGVPEAVVEGWEMTRRGGHGPGARGSTPIAVRFRSTPNRLFRKQLRVVGVMGPCRETLPRSS